VAQINFSLIIGFSFCDGPTVSSDGMVDKETSWMVYCCNRNFVWGPSYAATSTAVSGKMFGILIHSSGVPLLNGKLEPLDANIWLLIKQNTPQQKLCVGITTNRYFAKKVYAFGTILVAPRPSSNISPTRS
jgi:hypothetical protein